MAMGIMDALDAQFKRMASDPGRGQAKQVMQAVNQRQPVNPIMGLAAAAALQQTPQPQAQAPQGTVLQRLAQQAAPMGAMGGMNQGQLASPAGGMGQAPMPPQMGQAPMPPQMQGMAGGGLVSFAEGGVLPPDVLDAIQEHFAQGGAVRGFPTGGSLQALSSMIFDAPGYFESGDVIDQDNARRRQELYEREAAKEAAEKAALREREIIEGFRRRPSPHVSESISNPPTEPSAYQQRAGMSPYELPKEAPAPRGPRGLDPSKLSKEAQEFLAREIPVAEKLKELPKIGKKLGRFKPGPLGVALDAGFMFDTLLDPEFQKQYAEDWKEYMPSWMGGRGASQEDKTAYTLPQEGLYSIPQGGIRLPQKDEDYSDIMRGEAGETFPSAGLASLPRSGKTDPETGAAINARVKPISEAKQTGYKTPEEQTIDINNKGITTSSLTEGESYGVPEDTGGIGGLEQMRDMLSELRGHKKISPDIQKRLDEMKEQARMSTIFQTALGGLAGGLSSYGRGPHAWGDAAMQSLAAYQHGAGAESALDKDIFNIQRDYADASIEEQQKAADFLLKAEEEKAKLASEERRAANRGGLSYDERSALQTQRDIAAEARARLYGENRDITNREATARQSADTEYKAAMNKGENPDYLAILEKYRRQLGLVEGGLGGGGLGGSGGLTVTRQGISR